ncbi:MAG: hypothetical protein PV345_03825 [Wolbachia sp.]|nr:hypothetical protein [Wolbachia sp.]
MARSIVFDGKIMKKVKLKQEHLSLSVCTFFTGIIVSFSSLFMQVFFKNASIAASSIEALTIFISSLINRRTFNDIKELEVSTYLKYNKLVSFVEEYEVNSVKDELTKLISSYAHHTPYACSIYVKH